MSDLHVARLKDLPVEHLLSSGTALCAGCGGLEAIREAYDVLGENTVFVNAAGCMTLLSVYPFTPFRGGWLYTAMASAPAGAQGVRDALDIRIADGVLPAKEKEHVVVLTGDGAAYGMGLSSTSGAIERNLDFIYLCYDNEGYGNTGHQTSGATPHGARTATSPGVAGHGGEKKDLFALWAAHGNAYVATAVAAEPLDLARKVERARDLPGPRLLLVLSPCPTGWGYDPKETVEIGRLAVKTGVWPLKEYIDGRVVHNKVPRPLVPVEEYLIRQGRFRHLFEPTRDVDGIAHIQNRINAYWEAVRRHGPDS